MIYIDSRSKLEDVTRGVNDLKYKISISEIEIFWKWNLTYERRKGKESGKDNISIVC